MTQQAATTRSSPDVLSKDVQKVREQLARSELDVSMLEAKVGVLAEQQQRVTGAERERLNRQWAQAMHDLSKANFERQSAELRMNQLLRQEQPNPSPVLAKVGPPEPKITIAGPQLDVAVQPSPKIATTAPPDPFLGPKDIVTIYTGGVILLLPLVLALSRRLWVRGIRRESLDLENSPRLQRIEQAVESIAVEVERIGEAQRFTTKLLAERQLDGAARIPVQPRREPGTITPH